MGYLVHPDSSGVFYKLSLAGHGKKFEHVKSSSRSRKMPTAVPGGHPETLKVNWVVIINDPESSKSVYHIFLTQDFKLLVKKKSYKLQKGK